MNRDQVLLLLVFYLGTVSSEPLPLAQVQKIKARLESGALLAKAAFAFQQEKAKAVVEKFDAGQISVTLSTSCDKCPFKLPHVSSSSLSYKGNHIGTTAFILGEIKVALVVKLQVTDDVVASEIVSNELISPRKDSLDGFKAGLMGKGKFDFDNWKAAVCAANAGVIQKLLQTQMNRLGDQAIFAAASALKTLKDLGAYLDGALSNLCIQQDEQEWSWSDGSTETSLYLEFRGSFSAAHITKRGLKLGKGRAADFRVGFRISDVLQPWQDTTQTLVNIREGAVFANEKAMFHKECAQNNGNEDLECYEKKESKFRDAIIEELKKTLLPKITAAIDGHK